MSDQPLGKPIPFQDNTQKWSETSLCNIVLEPTNWTWESRNCKTEIELKTGMYMKYKATIVHA